jgi:hypothetical protein
MTTIQQTLEIPINRRLHLDLDLPDEIVPGMAEVMLVFAQSEYPKASTETQKISNLRSYLQANTPRTLEEAKKEAAAKAADPNRKPFSRHCGTLKGSFGDGLAYQQAMRNEWE